MELDAWLRAGGVVVSASERARRAALAQYHRARRAEGLSAWNTPAIYDWAGFVREHWEHAADGRLVLSAMQEEALWSRVIAEQNPSAAVLREPRRRLAQMAMDAHGLLCSHAPRFLKERARSGWRQDAEAFNGWLGGFDEACGDGAMVSAARLPLELLERLENDATERPGLQLVGFDRVLPMQKRLFDAWGTWRLMEAGSRAQHIQSYAALDAQSELDACAAWCRRHIERQPGARVLVITQDVARRRGEIERAFLRHANEDAAFRFEFSLGVPLDRVGVVRSAQVLLRWLSGAIEEAEIDWLFSTSYATRELREAAEFQAFLRALRRYSLQRMRWRVDELIGQQPAVRAALPRKWAARIANAQQRLDAMRERTLSPVEWAALVPQLLEATGWPGGRELGSVEYQAVRRFEQVVDACGSLGFDGRRMDWGTFFAELNDALAGTLFAPESQDAPIVIAGPAESAGLTADAIWFLSAHEDAWPARGSMHPLLPPDVQREFGMPHASPQRDYELAQAITERLAGSANEVCFSFARQQDDVEARASRLVAQIAAPPIPLPAELVETMPGPLATTSEDTSGIPIAPGAVRGGAAVLTAQSQCPFRGFATARLDARGWDAAEPGLTPAQRGRLLHQAMHNIWAGKPDGVRTLEELRAIADKRSFVAAHVERAMQVVVSREMREQMPERYLALEAERLTRLVTEWLAYEAERLPFAVEEAEYDTTANVAGLAFHFRLDRVDRLADGSLLVIDYKTGDVSPKAWELPRPDDVQLPLYAEFGLPEAWPVGGLAFAKIRAGDVCFAGCMKDADATLGAIANIRSLKKTALKDGALDAWRTAIEQLAHDFLAGRADVDPRDPVKTCERCGLHTLCRVHEQALTPEDEAGEEDADG